MTTPDGYSAIVTGDVTIDGTPYYDNDPTTGALDIIGSNEQRRVCGAYGFNLQTNILNSQVQSVVSTDIYNMEHVSGCGSTCASVTTNTV